MRIQAFNKLTSQKSSALEMDEYLAIAKQDTSEYLRYRSNLIQNQLQKNEDIMQNGNNPVQRCV